MTPGEQRIAIAEACGWTTISDYGENGVVGFNAATSKHEVIPDYLNDLNAINQAVRHMEPVSTARRITSSSSFVKNYVKNLERVIMNRPGFICPSPVRRFLMVNATPTQRAEALLRTIGKWTGNAFGV